LQTALGLLPLYWILPYTETMWLPLLSGSVDTRLLIVLAAYYVYIAVIKLAFMYIQFGIVTQSGMLPSLRLLVRRFLSIAVLSISIILFYFIIAAVGMTISFVYAGIIAVILHQLYHLVKAMFRLWEIGAQHQYYMSKTP
jgi:hypothetical protein